MENNEYLPRVADVLITEYLKAFRAVCIEGPKWCGKTWTAQHHAASQYLIADPADNFAARERVALDLNFAFAGEEPHLIDEWQEFPQLWDATKFHVDKSSRTGQIILTGSSTPNEKGEMHTGTGRIVSFRMRPMSLWESGHSGGEVSLRDVCEGDFSGVVATRRMELQMLIELILRGGWPGTVKLPFEHAVKTPAAYARQIIDRDVHRVDGIRRDKHKIELLMRSLARNEATTAGVTTLKQDISEADGILIEDNTINSYLDALGRLFVLENQRPFASAMRSGLRIKKAEKRHFCDPSIAAALLKATPAKLLKDLRTLGFLFEALVERDLRTYAEAFGGELYHYQDYANREVDAVIEMPDGEWTAIEIKLGLNQEEAAAENLKKISAQIAAAGGRPPKNLVVIVGMSSAAYRRADGVVVCPLNALKS